MPGDDKTENGNRGRSGHQSPGAAEFEADLVQFMPNLRAFALSLSANIHRADDLVQETMLKALSNREKFEVGTNLRAWLFTILRNTFLSEARRGHREVLVEGQAEAPPDRVMSHQEARTELFELSEMIESLPELQRRALLLVGGNGHSYEEAALICGCAVGTIKSRVNRARRRLDEIYGGD